MRIGNVSISDDVLLKFLQLEGGNITNVFRPIGVCGCTKFTIEHEEMPIIKNGYQIPDINLRYSTFHTEGWHDVITREPIICE